MRYLSVKTTDFTMLSGAKRNLDVSSPHRSDRF